MWALLSAASFVAFVLAALGVRFAGPQDARRAVHTLIVASLLLSFSAGLSQRDLFPFVAWPLVAGVVPSRVHTPRIAAVAADGAEYLVDYRAWSPIALDELLSWIDLRFDQLTPAQRRAAGDWLLARAERARAGASHGDGMRSFGFLGPLDAPFFLLHPRPWDDPARVPADSFVGLAFYRDSWDVDARARGAPVTADRFFTFRRAH